MQRMCIGCQAHAEHSVKDLSRILCSQVQAYFCGHDHNLEHLYHAATRTHTIVSGAGSKCGRMINGTTDSLYQYPAQGFVVMNVGQQIAVADFYTLEGGHLEPAYTAIIPKQLE